jgi:hypothetical protein
MRMNPEREGLMPEDGDAGIDGIGAGYRGIKGKKLYSNFAVHSLIWSIPTITVITAIPTVIRLS